jgi:hypothetical protein
MSDLLQTIQEQIAKEWFEKKMPHVPKENQKFDLLIPYTQLDLWPEVCKRYASEERNQAIEEARKIVWEYRHKPYQSIAEIVERIENLKKL